MKSIFFLHEPLRCWYKSGPYFQLTELVGGGGGQKLNVEYFASVLRSCPSLAIGMSITNSILRQTKGGPIARISAPAARFITK
jgi:hypothetical protein